MTRSTDWAGEKRMNGAAFRFGPQRRNIRTACDTTVEKGAAAGGVDTDANAVGDILGSMRHRFRTGTT
jgi:hypothetical protein